MGPYPLGQVNLYLEKGWLLPNDSAWHDGMADWVLLSDVAGVIVPNKDTPPPLPTPKESPVSGSNISSPLSTIEPSTEHSASIL